MICPIYANTGVQQRGVVQKSGNDVHVVNGVVNKTHQWYRQQQGRRNGVRNGVAQAHVKRLSREKRGVKSKLASAVTRKRGDER